MNSKDASAIGHILDYCMQINCTLTEFDNCKERFMASKTCRNAISLCLLQIGELVTVLSDEFKAGHSNISWREMKYLRNIVAHRYNTVDYDIIWKICLSDVPELLSFCRELLAE